MPTEARNPNPAETLIEGVLERIVYYNEENGYCIGEVRAKKSTPVVTIVGNMPGVQCGETMTLNGEWTRHAQYGPQFKVSGFEVKLPASVYGIRKYLGSGLVPGIGKAYADRIVDKFGAGTLRVISEESKRLREVEGIGRERAKSIKEAWDKQHAERELMVFLQTYGVSTTQCQKLIQKYGAQAKQILQTEPYRVAREIERIGFKTADKIAINLGFANDSPPRIDAGIIHALKTLEDDGHTGIEPDNLQQVAVELLDTDAQLVGERMKALVEQKELIIDEGSPLLQLPGTREAERRIAEGLRRLADGPDKLPAIIIDKAVAWAQERAGFEFAPEQAEAVRTCLNRKVTVITGGPGTGKTTILRAVCDIIRAKKVNPHLASPTGRAAQRLAEAAGQKAQTLHRLLQFDPQEMRFMANEDNPLRGSFFIVDEASMLDTRLAAALVRALPASARLVLVGDIDQLPSVGCGNVLRDIIGSGRAAVARLERIFRQGEQSGIVTTAHAILHGEAGAPHITDNPAHIDPDKDIQFVVAPEPEACAQTVVRICKDILPDKFNIDPISDVQVLAPMHKGLAGIANLNHILQDALNPQQSGIRYGQTLFQSGDKVIQLRNNYDKALFNGDLGRVTRINTAAGTIAATFNGVEIDFERAELSDLAPAFAFSIHKSQGSEFPCVIIPLVKGHFMMLQRNLLYTGITRGKKKVILVGDPAAYAMAVRNRETAARKTDLRRKIAESDF